ncbi:MAG: hypothetical protein J7M24_07965 [Candidatus Latescibacteria bacterium]|nr:hypothetical protein [Candidatus Latescibacterota bacterium]
MNRIEELKTTLRHNIALHEQLRDALREECASIASDDIDSLPMNNARKHRIEAEITGTNRAVMSLFESYYRHAVSTDSLTREEVDRLVEKLRWSILEAVKAVGETVKTIKHAKKDIVGRLKLMDQRKNALNAYARTKFV